MSVQWLEEERRCVFVLVSQIRKKKKKMKRKGWKVKDKGKREKMDERNLELDVSAERRRESLSKEGGLATSRFSNTAIIALGTRLGEFSLLDLLDHLDGRLRRQVLVKDASNLHHRGVGARSKALDLNQRELFIRRRLSVVDVKVILDGLLDSLRAAEHARGGGAHTNDVLANLFSDVHRVESGDLVDLHGRDFEDLGDLVHGDQGKPSVLLLGEGKEGHGGTLLVLLGVLGDDFVDLGHVLICKLKGCRRVVVGRVDVKVVSTAAQKGTRRAESASRDRVDHGQRGSLEEGHGTSEGEHHRVREQNKRKRLLLLVSLLFEKSHKMKNENFLKFRKMDEAKNGLLAREMGDKK